MNLFMSEVNCIDNSILFSDKVVKYYSNHEEWIKKCKIERRRCLVCENDGKILGCSILKKSKMIRDALKIGYFYVEEKNLHKGIGTAMLAKIEEYAQENHLRFVYTTVKKEDFSSKFFLVKRGYGIVNITKLGEYVLKKKLNGGNFEICIHSFTSNEWNAITRVEILKINMDKLLSVDGIIAFVDNRCGEILAGIITVEKDLSCKTDYLIQQITVFKHTAYKLYSLKKDTILLPEEVEELLLYAEEDYERILKS